MFSASILSPSALQNDTSQASGWLLFQCLQYVPSFCSQWLRVLMSEIPKDEHRVYTAFTVKDDVII